MSSRRNRIKTFPKNYCPARTFLCELDNEKGEGVVQWNGKRYIVNELLVGEEAYIQVYYEDEKFGYARATKLVVPSESRSLPLGHYKMQLGSYHIAHMQESAQDAWKQSKVEKLFSWQKVAKIIVGERQYYRNKVALSDGGFHASGYGRKRIITPRREEFDLMDIDFEKYNQPEGNFIIRRLDTEIAGPAGANLNTTHHFMGVVFHVNLNSFYQVNSEMAALAYQKILEFVPFGSVVFDLFAGAATIGVIVARQAKQVYSVELSKSSYEDALKNITLNNLKNIKAINADANIFVVSAPENPDVVIFDPSRSGVSEESMRVINNSRAKRIIYLSCNIYTQARDLAFLTNYKTILIQPYDFFPQTYHIENLVVLELKV